MSIQNFTNKSLVLPAQAESSSSWVPASAGKTRADVITKMARLVHSGY